MTSASALRREGDREPRDDLDALSEELATLRDRVANVDYRSAVLRMLLGADDQRHLEVATADLESALRSFRTTADSTVTRAAATAERFGVRPDERILSVVAERAPERWRAQLMRDTRELAKDTARLREQLTSDVGLVSGGRRQVNATLQLLLGDDDSPVTYETPGTTQPHLIDHLA